LALDGCAPTIEPRVRYNDARAKLHQGYVDAAAQQADAGFRQLDGRDPLWGWRFRLLKAETLLWKGDLEGTNALLRVAPPGDLPSDISIRRKILQGKVLCRLGRLVESEAALDEAEHLAKLDERELRSELAFARGRCTPAGNREAARVFYQQSADLAHGIDAFGEARGLVNVGYFLVTEGKYPAYHQAINTLTTALSISDSYLLREQAFGNVAECYAALGDWKQSISFAEQAENLAAQIGKDDDREAWLIDLGRAHRALFEFSKAGPYFNEALAIAKRLNDTDATWRSLNNLIQLALAQHDLSAAEKSWKEESALNLGVEGRPYVSFDAAGIAMERKEFTKAEQLLKGILASKANISLRLLTRRELGNVYWQGGSAIQADQAFREAIKDAEAEIEHIPAEHQMSFLDELPFYDSYVRFLVAQNKPLEALKIAERGRAQILSRALRSERGGGPAFDLAKLQSLLKERNEIALAYSLTNEESFLWVITPTRSNCVRLPSHTAIAAVFKRNDAEIRDPRPIEASPAGQELYKTLVQPAQDLIPKGSHVVVIPSKILSLINFEALIVPGADPHYWINDVQVETASSLTMLAQSRPAGPKAVKSRKDLFLLGAPVAADSSLPVLKHAAEEIDRVRSHFPAREQKIIYGKDAIPPAYRAGNPGAYRFVHIDAHSIASDLSPLDSYVVLSPAPNHAYKLYAHEITNTPLRADLVTISACYGAGTRWYNGEGIVGLGWAFLRAGAHQVVASLWAVDDASTPQLMDDFYAGLSQGKSAAESLRAAKLKMLEAGGKNSQPYYWASLQLYSGS
jgi:CHAT domain-containing protein